MKVPFAIAAALLSMIVGLPASAHHSFAAEFDASKAIRVSGTLTKIDWANPHIYFYLDVKEDGGNVVNGVVKRVLPERYPGGALRKATSSWEIP